MKAKFSKQVQRRSARSTARPTSSKSVSRNYSSTNRANNSSYGLFASTPSSFTSSSPSGFSSTEASLQDKQRDFDYGANDSVDYGESTEELHARLRASEYNFGPELDNDAENIVGHALSSLIPDGQPIIQQPFLEACVKEILAEMGIEPSVKCVSAAGFNTVVSQSRILINKKLKEMTATALEEFLLGAFPEEVRPLIKLACSYTLDSLKTASAKDTVLGQDPLRAVYDLKSNMEQSLKNKWLTREEARSVIPSVRKIAENLVSKFHSIPPIKKNEEDELAVYVLGELNEGVGVLFENGLDLVRGQFLAKHFESVVSKADVLNKALILKVCEDSKERFPAEDLNRKIQDPKYGYIAILICILVGLFVLYTLLDKLKECSDDGVTSFKEAWEELDNKDNELLEQLKLEQGLVQLEIQNLKEKIQDQEHKKQVCDLSQDYLNWDKHHKPEKGWCSYAASYFKDTSVTKFIEENKKLDTHENAELIKKIESRVEAAKNGKFKNPVDDISHEVSDIENELASLSSKLIRKQAESLKLIEKSQAAVEHLTAFKNQLADNSYSCGM